MAGSRHHFIPRFLMKGFATFKKEGNYQTYVYKKNKQVFLTNTNNINIETEFYGNENSSELDNKITDIEQSFLSYLDEIKSLNHSCLLDKSFCDSFISHIAVRTRHIRNATKNLTNDVFAHFIKNTNTLESFEDFLINAIKRDEQNLRIQIQQGILTQNPSFELSKLNNVIDEVIRNLVNYNTVGSIEYKKPNIFADMVRCNLKQEHEHYLKSLEEIINQSNSLSKKLHNQALNEVIDKELSDNFEHRFKKLKWHMHYDSNAEYILGDVGPIGCDIEGNYGCLGANSDDFYLIYFPISSNHLIIGYTDEEVKIPNMEELNLNIAKVCEDYFICKNNSESNEKYKEEIATNLFVLDLSQIF